jgi:hypothetical protein
VKLIFCYVLLSFTFWAKAQSSSQLINRITGTWLNVEFLNALEDPKDSIDFDYSLYVPRVITVSKNGHCSFELGFERLFDKGKFKSVKVIDNKIVAIFFEVYGFTLTLKNDSLLKLTYSNKKNLYAEFVKLRSNGECNSCGIQYYLKDKYWGNSDKWIMTTYDKDSSNQNVIIKYGKIINANNNVLIREFEFADDYLTEVNGVKSYTIVFFDTIKSMMENQKVIQFLKVHKK